MESVVREARERKGYVETLFKSVVGEIPDIILATSMFEARSGRLSTHPSGSAADILKIAMITWTNAKAGSMNQDASSGAR